MNTNNADWQEVDKALLSGCLDQLLASPPFTKSPRQQDLLRYLVDRTVDGQAARLKGYKIGVEVFGRADDFDPAVDAIVRVEVARLRGKLQEYYSGPGRADPLYIDLPKGGYGIRFLTPPGPEMADTTARRHSRPLDDRPSLAVLPLANLSPEPGQDYFVDGITDSLIYGLSRLSGLFVISRQSSFAYRGSEKSSAAIGAELGVKYLLEGSVQRAGQRVRITVQLVEAASGARSGRSATKAMCRIFLSCRMM